jgi:3-hydroxymyristoyl/3-hydroxydecanoyl-(acyl carrier protein) dehydratase
MSDAYTFIDFQDDGSQVKAKIMINWDSKVFQEHFPELPIFPGALLVHCISELVALKYQNHQVVEVSNLKFLNPVLKGLEMLHVDLILDSSGKLLRCSILAQDRLVCKGVLTLK